MKKEALIFNIRVGHNIRVKGGNIIISELPNIMYKKNKKPTLACHLRVLVSYTKEFFMDVKCSYKQLSKC